MQDIPEIDKEQFEQIEEQVIKEAKRKKKMTKASKLFFGMFVFLTVLSIFLFWAVDNVVQEEVKPYTIIAAVISVGLAVFFGLMSFVRFLRSRSIAGGLFLTTALSTGVFLGTSRFMGVLIPPTVFGFGEEGAAAEAGGFSLLILLAQIGLFAVWFAFLIFTIHAQVSPVKKVDKCIGKILAGDEVKRVRIGKSRQYRELEKKIVALSEQMKKCKIQE